MIRVLAVLIVFAALAGGLVLLAGLVNRRGDGQAVRRKDLKTARRALADAEKTILDVQRLALTNIDFQPHLAGVVLTTVQDYLDNKQQKELT